MASAGRDSTTAAHAKDLKVLKWGAAGGDARGSICGDVPVPSPGPGGMFWQGGRGEGELGRTPAAG